MYTSHGVAVVLVHHTHLPSEMLDNKIISWYKSVALYVCLIHENMVARIYDDWYDMMTCQPTSYQTTWYSIATFLSRPITRCGMQPCFTCVTNAFAMTEQRWSYMLYVKGYDVIYMGTYTWTQIMWTCPKVLECLMLMLILVNNNNKHNT